MLTTLWYNYPLLKVSFMSLLIVPDPEILDAYISRILFFIYHTRLSIKILR